MAKAEGRIVATSRGRLSKTPVAAPRFGLYYRSKGRRQKLGPCQPVFFCTKIFAVYFALGPEESRVLFMPVERRDVLFSLVEINPVLVRAAGKSVARIPGNLSSMSVIEAMHTRDVSTSFHNQLTKLLNMLKETPEGDGVIFRATKPAAIIGERQLAFFVPDKVMLDVLLAACASLQIALPRRAKKLVIAQEFKIGLRFILDDNAMEFET